jgi:hypothetical protein
LNTEDAVSSLCLENINPASAMLRAHSRRVPRNHVTATLSLMSCHVDRVLCPFMQARDTRKDVSGYSRSTGSCLQQSQHAGAGNHPLYSWRFLPVAEQSSTCESRLHVVLRYRALYDLEDVGVPGIAAVECFCGTICAYCVGCHCLGRLQWPLRRYRLPI